MTSCKLKLALALMLVINPLLFAQPNTKASHAVNFNQELKNLDGTPILDSPGGKPVTLKTIVITVLESSMPEDKNKSGLDKFKLDELARKVFNSTKDTTFSLEELTLIKTRIGEGYDPKVVGSAWRIIDPAGE
jgi:hypothetical protein